MFPDDFARSLTYNKGRALGLAAGAGDLRYAGFFLEARVLTRRYRRVSSAARLMCVAEAGLRGFLDGATGHSLIGDEPIPRT